MSPRLLLFPSFCQSFSILSVNCSKTVLRVGSDLVYSDPFLYSTKTGSLYFLPLPSTLGHSRWGWNLHLHIGVVKSLIGFRHCLTKNPFRLFSSTHRILSGAWLFCVLHKPAKEFGSHWSLSVRHWSLYPCFYFNSIRCDHEPSLSASHWGIIPFGLIRGRILKWLVHVYSHRTRMRARRLLREKNVPFIISSFRKLFHFIVS